MPEKKSKLYDVLLSHVKKGLYQFSTGGSERRYSFKYADSGADVETVCWRVFIIRHIFAEQNL